MNGQAMTLLDSALAYQQRGWSIIPAKYKNGRKQGAVRWKRYQQEQPDAKRLRGWFSKDKYPALAIVLGPISGNLACRDFDDPEAYENWAKNFPELAAKLPTVKTGRGYHVYFIAPVAKTIPFDDGELRGAKSLCILPPSPHPKGGCYQWLIELPDGPLPEIDPSQAGFLSSMQQKSTEEHTSERKITDSNGRSQSAERVKNSTAQIDEIQNAIAATLPNGPGQRHRFVFQFARALKGIPALQDAAAVALRPYVRQWHEQAMPYIVTKNFEDTWIDFLKAWPKITTPLRINLMEHAMKAAIDNPIPGLPYESAGVCNLLALCRELQAIMGNQPFFLACRTAGRLLEVHHVTASNWLFLLEHDGWIKTIEKGLPSTLRATRFRFIKEKLELQPETT